MKPIDWSRPVQTLDGRKVRVLCTDALGDHPVIGLVADQEGSDCWTLLGKYFSDNSVDHDDDLINAPERVERWLNLYEPDGPLRSVAQIDTLEDARKLAASDVVGQVRITYEDGKPVSVALEDVQ